MVTHPLVFYSKMKGKSMSTKNEKLFVEIERNKNKEWYWRAKHVRNHNSMAIGGEGYKSKRSCLNGVNTVFNGGVDIYEIGRDKNGARTKTKLD